MTGIRLRGFSAKRAQKDSESAYFLRNKVSIEALQSQLDNIRNERSRTELGNLQSRSSNINETSSSSISSNSSSSSTDSNFSSLSSSSNGGLQNVFTELGNIAETKAQNDQRRFREDLPFQARIYQDFDTEAAQRTEGIDTRAREQNSNLTKDRMRLQSQQNIAEEKNRGQVQVSTTGQIRDADLKRALSVLPRK